jgi:hypothetical protein
MDGDPAVLGRTSPLAESGPRVFRHTRDDAALDALYETHRGSCYEGGLTFPRLVGLVPGALTAHGGSGHAAFAQARRAGRWPVAETNASATRGRVPLAVSEALRREGSRPVAAVRPAAAAARPWPSAPAGFEPVAVDGKRIKDAARRLVALPSRPGALPILGKVITQRALIMESRDRTLRGLHQWVPHDAARDQRGGKHDEVRGTGNGNPGDGRP